jgi:twinkle protein
MMQDVREIILAADGDGPGVNLMNDLAIRLGKARCKFVRYPKETKDFNEAFLKYGESHQGDR